jgi:regulator of RNase E activity RraB
MLEIELTYSRGCHVTFTFYHENMQAIFCIPGPAHAILVKKNPMSLLDSFNLNFNLDPLSKLKKDLEKKLAVAPVTPDILKNNGLTPDNELRLEFFFYARAFRFAKDLAKELQKLGYEADVSDSEGSPGQFLVHGWSTKMKMGDNALQLWMDQMTDLGEKCHCDFDGWGMLVPFDQK